MSAVTPPDSPTPVVCLVNLGTPTEPTARAVRRYLRQFLSDRRVVDLPPALWRPVLEGIVLRVRPAASAARYAQVWGEQDSPLLAHTLAQREAVQQQLGSRAEVAMAMRYGSPSLPEVLDAALAAGHRRVLVVPLYPQYSATTVASVYDELAAWMVRSRDQAEVRTIRSFPTDPGYLAALTDAITGHWRVHGRPDFAAGDRLVLSYHAIPVSMCRAGDPYPAECLATSTAIRQALGLTPEQAPHSYQSRFGPTRWLEPATIDTLVGLARQGTRRVDVICPGFAADCLETLEEIDQLNREAFLGAAADPRASFHYLPWGNARPAWTGALTTLVEAHLAGWA